MPDPKIYLKLDKRPKNIQQLLHSLYNGNHSGSLRQTVTTYKNPECTTQQCRAGAYRSMDDIYYLCKTYFHNVTVKKVMHEILMFDKKTPTDHFYIMQFSNCGGMGRLRVIPYNQGSYGTAMCSKYQSKWTWKELFDMVGIKNQDDLSNYRKNHTII